mmetsp:Transcript_114769/g.244943  ORF Transcript_114769/g.244943 Transcript_114769/m.244943 type:complete len:95 (+) Transcript_114769:723-1007(+)
MTGCVGLDKAIPGLDIAGDTIGVSIVVDWRAHGLMGPSESIPVIGNSKVKAPAACTAAMLEGISRSPPDIFALSSMRKRLGERVRTPSREILEA